MTVSRTEIIALANEIDRIGEAIRPNNAIRGDQLIRIGAQVAALADKLPKPMTQPEAEAAQAFPIARPLREHFGLLLDAENRQIGKASPEYAVQLCGAINRMPK